MGKLDRKIAIVTGAGQGIGRAIAVRLGACGARVTAFRRHADAACPPGVAAVRGFDELLGELPRSDAVVLALPSTPATEGLLSRAHLGALKPGALVVNVGRGSTIDQEALVAGLAGGRIGGGVVRTLGEVRRPVLVGAGQGLAVGDVLVRASVGGSVVRASVGGSLLGAEAERLDQAVAAVRDELD